MNFNVDLAEGRLRQRRPDLFTQSTTLGGVGVLKEAFSLAERILRYLQRARTPLPAGHVETAKQECKQITTLLSERGLNLEYAFQGSATNGTLIRRHSDIDLLAVTKLFRYVRQTKATYEGDPTRDLRQLRAAIVDVTKARFRRSKVDPVPTSKAISIDGGEFTRSIDIVPAVWDYGDDGSAPVTERGVRLFDPKTGIQVASYPFHHSAAVVAKDTRCGGHYTALVRMLKSMVADVDVEGVSSFGVTSLVFHMPDAEIVADCGNVRPQLSRFIAFGARLAGWPTARTALLAPSGREPVFSDKALSVDGLNRLVGLASHVLGAVRGLP